MTTYVISGHPRSGTSMMMQAFIAGGMDAVWSQAREALRKWKGDADYDPNSAGLYELSDRQMKLPGFPRMYEGKLFKVMYSGVVHMVPGDYRVIFMRRNWEETRESYRAFFGGQMFNGIDAETFQSIMDDYSGILKERRDMDVTELWYDDVLASPDATFEMLRERGWPINAAAAAQVVDPSLKRHIA